MELLHDVKVDLPKGGRFLGDAFGVALIVGLYYGLDDTAAQDPAVMRELEEGIVMACTRIARGEDANE